MAEFGLHIAQRTRRAKKWNNRARIESDFISEEREELLGKGTEEMAIIIESEHEESLHFNIGQNQHDNGIESAVSESNSDSNQNNDDFQQRNITQKKGRFSPSQQKIITNAVGEFLTVSQISYEDFLVILNEKNVINTILKNAKFYQIIARALPERSVRSCYRFLRRCFNGRNRKGKWTRQQQDKLIKLVEERGHAWQQIGKILNRTGENVYDKCRQAQQWMLQIRQFVTLLLLVNARSGQNFIDQKIKDEREREKLHNGRQNLGVKITKYNSTNKVQPLIDLGMKYINNRIRQVCIQKIKWTELSKKLKKRSMIDCKNKFMQLMEYAIKAYKYDDIKIVQFLEGEEGKSQLEIDWLKWSCELIGSQQAKNRFMVLKKFVPNKGTLTFSEIVTEIRRRLIMKSSRRV